MGYVSWIGIEDEQDAVLIEILKEQGAVFYCKTNVPQTLMVRTPHTNRVQQQLLHQCIVYVYVRSCFMLNQSAQCSLRAECSVQRSNIPV